MGHACGGSAGGSGLVVPVSNYTLGLGYRRPAFVDGSATGPTYRGDVVYESAPHACTGKRDGEYVP